MHTPNLRFVIAAVTALVGLHFILSISHEGYGEATSIETIKKTWQDKWRAAAAMKNYKDAQEVPVHHDTTGVRKANAAFVFLARNNDLWGVMESLKQMEDRFNKKFAYPYVFLNEEPFSEEFIKFTSEVVSTNATYGIIPAEHWFQPSWIDEARASAGREKLKEKEVIYADSIPYRNMCRFNSGYFFRHPLLETYDYYWRIEPSVKFYCDIDYDPFLYMKDHNKVYGFNIALYEFGDTVDTLWKTTKDFINKYPQYVAANNSMRFLSDDGGDTYNLCHYWSNFEIGDLNFYRTEAYLKYFEHLDAAGGFYYERWGDAPVHSIAASLFAPKDGIHFFNDIGYRHECFEHCPVGDLHAKGKCWCNPKENFDYDGYSCLSRWEKAQAGAPA